MSALRPGDVCYWDDPNSENFKLRGRLWLIVGSHDVGPVHVPLEAWMFEKIDIWIIRRRGHCEPDDLVKVTDEETIDRIHAQYAAAKLTGNIESDL